MATYECWVDIVDIGEPGEMVEASSAAGAGEVFVKQGETFGDEDYEACVVKDEAGIVWEFEFRIEHVINVSLRRRKELGSYEELNEVDE